MAGGVDSGGEGGDEGYESFPCYRFWEKRFLQNRFDDGAAIKTHDGKIFLTRSFRNGIEALQIRKPIGEGQKESKMSVRGAKEGNAW